jgi:integrase
MSQRQSVPTYRRHKQSGQAIVTLNDGLGGRRDVLLGKYGSAASRREYRRVIVEWEANSRRLASPLAAADLTITELADVYWRHVKTYYVKNGEPTSEQDTIRQALRFVRDLYEKTLARDFGPLALKAIRQAMVEHPITRRYKAKNPATGKAVWQTRTLRIGLSRRYVNKQIGRIKRMFAWAVEEELLPVAVHQALLCVKGLKKGKGAAREKDRIKPVSQAFVEAVLAHVPPAVRTMIEVQQLCGCRPQDIVQMRAIDIDMTATVWEYRPARYKTEHHNDEENPDRERIVFLGPKAQALLKPYLTLNVMDYLFNPARSEEERNAKRREQRKTPRWPSHMQRQRASTRRRAPRGRYDVAAYRKAVRRACVKAGVPIWFPLQLRHSRGTEIRKRYGLEAASTVLGHAELGVTQVYAEADRDTARRVMQEIG